MKGKEISLITLQQVAYVRTIVVMTREMARSPKELPSCQDVNGEAWLLVSLDLISAIHFNKNLIRIPSLSTLFFHLNHMHWWLLFNNLHFFKSVLISGIQDAASGAGWIKRPGEVSRAGWRNIPEKMSFWGNISTSTMLLEWWIFPRIFLCVDMGKYASLRLV